MTSPLCTVNGAATPAYGLTPGATVTIALASVAGVNQWSIAAIATDETNTASAINASLTVNNTAKTATFTAPAAGSAVTFQSQVNGGLNTQTGIVDATQTVTFGCFVPASNGNNVLALGMTYEPSATNGWLVFFNAFARATVTSTTFSNDLSGTYTSQNVLGATAATKTFAYAATATAPGFTQASTTGATGQNITFAPQASTNANGSPGNLVVNLAARTGTGAVPALDVNYNAQPYGAMGAYPASPASGSCLWLAPGNLTFGTNNYVLYSDGASTFLNAPSSGSTIYIESGNTTTYAVFNSGGLTIDTGSLAFATAATATVSQASTSGATGQNITFAPQASTNANGTPGNLVVSLPAKTGTGTEAGFQVFRGSETTPLFQAGYSPVNPAVAALWLDLPHITNTAASSTNYLLQSDGANAYLNAPYTGGAVNLSVLNVSQANIGTNAGLIVNGAGSGSLSANGQALASYYAGGTGNVILASVGIVGGNVGTSGDAIFGGSAAGNSANTPNNVFYSSYVNSSLAVQGTRIFGAIGTNAVAYKPIVGDGVSSPYSVHGDIGSTLTVPSGGVAVTAAQYAKQFFSISSSAGTNGSTTYVLSGFPQAAVGSAYSKSFVNILGYAVLLKDSGGNVHQLPADTNLHTAWFTNAGIYVQ